MTTNLAHFVVVVTLALLTSREVVYEQELTGSPCPLGA
jgi:hypothetical protein